MACLPTTVAEHICSLADKSPVLFHDLILHWNALYYDCNVHISMLLAMIGTCLSHCLTFYDGNMYMYTCTVNMTAYTATHSFISDKEK